MPVTTTKPAAHLMAGSDPRLEENASAKLARKREEAQRATEALNGRRADTITPLVGKAPLATLPEPPLFADEGDAPEMPRIEIRTTVEHRGRSFTIVANGYTLDAFCDILDKRGYTPASQPTAPIADADDLPEGWKLCKKHGAPMRPRNKQNEHWHSHNVGTSENPCWCKGYKGADSPGYDR